MTVWNSTRFPGVRYKVPGTRRIKGRPEKYYSIRYNRHGRSIEEGVGWESAGVNPQYCSNLRTQIAANIRVGKGHQSLREMREAQESSRQKKADEKKANDRKNIIFDHLATQYLEWSQHNKESWKADESRYRVHIKQSLGNTPIKDIGIIQLERLKKDIRVKGKSEQTILHCLSLIRSMYNRAPGWDLYDGPNPVTETTKVDKKFLKIPDNSRLRFLTHEEANELLSELEHRSINLHNIALLSLHTGMRAGEIFSLSWADVDFQNKIITVRDPKNDFIRRVHMTPDVLEMFSEIKPKTYKINSLVFTDRNGNKIREVSNAFARAVDCLKLNDEVTDAKDRVVFHTLRHTFGSWLAMQSTSILMIKELLGHRKIEMTMRYAHLIPDQKRDAVLKLAKKQNEKVVDLDTKRKKK